MKSSGGFPGAVAGRSSRPASRPPMPEPGQAPGDPADLTIGHAENLGRFPHGHAGLEQDMAGHHGRMAGKTVQHAVDDRVPFVPGEIHVDVRRVRAAGVEESAEVEVVLHRADVGDAQAVGHQRGGRRSPAAGAGALRHDVLSPPGNRRENPMRAMTAVRVPGDPPPVRPVPPRSASGRRRRRPGAGCCRRCGCLSPSTAA
jgi:hypothetical protein